MLDKKYEPLIEDPQTLLTPKESFPIEVVHTASEIVHAFPGYFKPNPLGLYVPHQIMPLIKEKQNVWVKGVSHPVDYKFILEHKVPCMDVTNKVILTADMAARLSAQSAIGFYNIDSINYIKGYLMGELRRLVFEVKTDFFNGPDVLPEDMTQEEFDRLNVIAETELSEQVQAVISFVRDDPERIYFVRNTYNRLVIEKCGDIRAYLWLQEQWDKREEQRQLEEGH